MRRMSFSLLKFSNYLFSITKSLRIHFIAYSLLFFSWWTKYTFPKAPWPSLLMIMNSSRAAPTFLLSNRLIDAFLLDSIPSPTSISSYPSPWASISAWTLCCFLTICELDDFNWFSDSVFRILFYPKGAIFVNLSYSFPVFLLVSLRSAFNFYSFSLRSALNFWSKVSKSFFKLSKIFEALWLIFVGEPCLADPKELSETAD